MVDGLNSQLGDIGSESILDAGVDVADLAGSAASGTKVDVAFATVADNSGGKGNSVQFGEFVTNGGAATVTFGTAFQGTPTVVISNKGFTPTDNIGTMRVTATSTTTFGVTSAITGASQSGAWIACGSGRV
jgi:hypothetical protein